MKKINPLRLAIFDRAEKNGIVITFEERNKWDHIVFIAHMSDDTSIRATPIAYGDTEEEMLNNTLKWFEFRNLK